MIQSKSLGSKIFNVFNIILMSLLSLSCLYPLWYTLCLSVSDKAAANSGKVSFYPVGFSLASYQHRERAGHDLPVCHVVVYARCRFSCHISAPWYYAKNRTSIVLTDTRHATKKQ